MGIISLITIKNYNIMETRRLLFFIFIMCSIFTYSQSSFYYYKGTKVPIEPDRQKVAVFTEKGKSADELIKVSSLNLKLTSEQIRDVKYNISVLELKEAIDEKNYNTLLSTLKKGDNILMVQPCFKSQEGKELVTSNYLYIKLKDEKDLSKLELYAEKLNLEIVERNRYMPLWYTLRTTPETPLNALETANQLFETKEFAAAAPDLVSDDRLCVNDPSFSQQWGLNNTTYPEYDVSACQAWSYATGSGVKIAILDQGIQLTHQDLAANIYPLSYDSESNSSPSLIFGDHGTHCAGIAAAVRNNGIQIAGVAPGAKLISVSNSLYSTANSRIKRADGINWAWKNGADIISNSWGSSEQFEVIDEAIDSAFYLGRYGRGTVVVFAAGNNYRNPVSYPANCRPGILAVGSITNTGTLSSFSNLGPGMDVVAPGSSILSTVLNNGIGTKSGTSMACPHVAGIAALVIQRNPYLTSDQVNAVIESSAKKIGSIPYNPGYENGTWNTEFGYGLADAYNAVINTPLGMYYSNSTEDESTALQIGDIFPNPVSDQATVVFTLPVYANSQIRINSVFNTSVVYTYYVAEDISETTIDVSSLPSGIYSVSIISDGQKLDTKKLIKQ